MIGSISKELTISYSNKDLTKKGKHDNDPLHIIADAKSKRILMFLIDEIGTTWGKLSSYITFLPDQGKKISDLCSSRPLLLNQFLCLGCIPVGKVIWWMGLASPFPFSKAIKKA